MPSVSVPTPRNVPGLQALLARIRSQPPSKANVLIAAGLQARLDAASGGARPGGMVNVPYRDEYASALGQAPVGAGSISPALVIAALGAWAVLR